MSLMSASLFTQFRCFMSRIISAELFCGLFAETLKSDTQILTLWVSTVLQHASVDSLREIKILMFFVRCMVCVNFIFICMFCCVGWGCLRTEISFIFLSVPILLKISLDFFACLRFEPHFHFPRALSQPLFNLSHLILMCSLPSGIPITGNGSGVAESDP